MSDTTNEYIAKALNAAPFADNEAGIPQMCELICGLRDERDHVQRALEPFGKMAGELFARNYGAEDVVLFFKSPEGGDIKLDFADFLVVRDALQNPIT